MKFARKRERAQNVNYSRNGGELKNDHGRLLGHIAQRLMWFLVALFAYLGYYVEVRPYFSNHHGIWSVGFLDGAIVTSTLIIFGFYVWSILNAEEQSSCYVIE